MHIQRLHQSLGELVNLTTSAEWTGDDAAKARLATLIGDIRAEAAWHNGKLQTVLDHHHLEHEGKHVHRDALPSPERLGAEFITFDVSHLVDPPALERERKKMLKHFDLEPLDDEVPVHVALIHEAAVLLFNEVGIYMNGPHYRRTHGSVTLAPDGNSQGHRPDTPGHRLKA